MVSRTKLYVVIAAVLCLFWSAASHSAPDPRSSRSFYLSTFGPIDAGNEFAHRAESIFTQLMSVVDKARAKDPSLIIVNSKSWPWAVALPDNSIVLTRGALDLCYQGVSVEDGDVRLSMIIGHELAHLAEDDYWHRDIYLAIADNEEMLAQEVFSFIGQRSGVGDLTNSEWLNAVRDREIRADDKGFLYSAIAGFDVAKLIDHQGQSFFQYWKSNTGDSETAVHLSAKDRTAFVSARFSDLSKMAEAFHLGLGLIYFNHLDLAEDVFKYILDKFPSHEVYNNLGYIFFLQSGILKEGSISNRFWLPSIVDVKPSGAILTRGFSLDPKVDREKLEKAAYYFAQAIEKNPSYLEGNLNLSTANFYLGKYNAAISILREIESLYPDNPALQEIIVLASYNDLGAKVDLSGHVVNTLKELITRNPQLASAKFNLAQLYTLWGETEKAQILWRQLADEHAVPEPYWARVVSQVDSANDNQYESFDNKTQDMIAGLPRRTMARRETRLFTLADNTSIFRVDHGNGVIEYRDQERSLFTRYEDVSATIGSGLVTKLARIRGNELRDISLYADTDRTLLLFKQLSKNEVWLIE